MRWVRGFKQVPARPPPSVESGHSEYEIMRALKQSQQFAYSRLTACVRVAAAAEPSPQLAVIAY